MPVFYIVNNLLRKCPPYIFSANIGRHSWVSWPLAVLLQGAEIDEVSMR